MVPRLAVDRLSKYFAATRALDEVSITIAPGEIHAVIGQNGSGKSTLVKVLSGYHKPTSGTVEMDGRPLPLPLTPKLVRGHGLAVVHQDLGLVTDQSVTENIRVGDFRSRLRIDWRNERAIAKETLRRLGADIDANVMVGTLGPADRALVAIARALQTKGLDGGLVLLDESTRALPRSALPGFYATLRSICDEGGAVLLVTHQLPEVQAVADKVSVLRNGRLVAGGIPTADVSEGDLARAMIGTELREVVRHPAAKTPKEDVKSFDFLGLTGRELDVLDFSVAAGEILGITGMPGSGHEELPYLITGAVSAQGGSYRCGSQRIDLTSATTRGLVAQGIALVPERRIEEGLAVDQTVKDNLTLPRLRSRGRPYFVGEKWRSDETATAIQRLGIEPPDPAALVSQLSGGNQQKVLVAKWLMNQPQLLVLHEPTQGVDVGARVDVLSIILEVARAGAAVVVSSGDPDDLVAICDRVLILRHGTVAGELFAPIGADDILDAVYGVIATGASDQASQSTTKSPQGEAGAQRVGS